MDRLHYLADPEVRRFVEYLRMLAIEGNGAALAIGRGSRRRPVATLLDAQRAFRWRGRDFAEVSRQLEHFRLEMIDALGACQTTAAGCRRGLGQYELLYVCSKILEWANCRRGVLGYLTERAQADGLSGCLTRAASVIDGETDDTSVFADPSLRSDPQIARLYAVMNERTVAYNGRLAAAMGLLCRHHLAFGGSSTSPPSELDFRLASSRPRHDPSLRGQSLSGQPPFRQCTDGTEHARWNVRTNWILDAVAEDAGLAALGETRRERLRALEAALFMLGDDVRSRLMRARRGPRAAAAHRAGQSRRTG